MSAAAAQGAAPRGAAVGPTARVLAVAIAALVAIGGLAWEAPTATARPLLTGVTNPGTNAPLAFERVRDAGGTMVRIPLYWGATAPDSRPASWDPANPDDPAYEWGRSDDAVANAVAAGLTPILQVDGAPRWAQGCTSPQSLASAVCNPSPDDLRAFGAAAARRYSGAVPGVPAVRFFQGLNEPNLSLFFLPQFDVNGRLLSPFLYRDLINAFYAGVKGARPDALVIAAGLGPNAVPGHTIGPMQFARKMLCLKGGAANPRPTKGDCGGGVHFDIFAIQPYTTGGPSHEGRANDVQLGDLPKLQRLIRAANKAGRIKGAYRWTPLWITEFSWDSRPPDPGGVQMRILKRWVAEALHRAWSAGVKRFLWFSLSDESRDGSEPYSETLESGLYFHGPTPAGGAPKPIVGAFRFPFVAYPRKKGLHFWGRTPDGQRGTVRIQVRRGKGWRTVRKLRSSKAGIFRGRVGIGYGRNKRGSVRAHYRKQASVPFSMRPVRDYYQPPFGKPVG